MNEGHLVSHQERPPKYEIDKEIDKQTNEKNRQYLYTQEKYIYKWELSI